MKIWQVLHNTVTSLDFNFVFILTTLLKICVYTVFAQSIEFNF